MAFFGGTSILFPFPYYLFTISFGAAGLHPLLLGISAGIGTLIGDSTNYYLAYRGGDIAPQKASQFFSRIFKWSMGKNPAIIPLFVLLYTSFMPLSDDLIIIPAGLVKYPFGRLAVSALAGKTIFNTLLALSGAYGWNLIVQ